MNATTTSSRTPTVEAANVVERWVYLGVRESGKSTEAKPVTLHAWKRPNGDVAFWGKHGPKGAHSPSVGQCFYFDVKTTGQPDGSDGITVWFGTRAFAGNDHGLDDDEQRSWRGLMVDMSACSFEGYRGDVLLAEAIIEREGLIEGKRLASL